VKLKKGLVSGINIFSLLPPVEKYPEMAGQKIRLNPDFSKGFLMHFQSVGTYTASCPLGRQQNLQLLDSP